MGGDGLTIGFDNEAACALVLSNRFHIDTAADGSVDHLRIGLQIIRDGFFGDEITGLVAWKFHAGKAVMPCGPICDERVPAGGSPTFCNSVALKDDVINA